MNHIYEVTATHVAEKYAAKSKRVLVTRDRIDGTFTATASPYGCGKSAATPEAAIRSLLSDNACRDIQVVGPVQSGQWLAACDL